MEEIISRQKRSQDKEGLGFLKHGQTSSISLTKPITFVKAKENETSKPSEADALLDASTRQQRARPLRKVGVSSKINNKSITPQAPFANTRGNQASIKGKENPKQNFDLGFHNGLGYT